MNTLLLSPDQSKSDSYEITCPYNDVNICMASITSFRLDEQKRKIVVVQKIMMTVRYSFQSY